MDGHYSIRRLVWAGPLVAALAALADLAFYGTVRLARGEFLISPPGRPLQPLPLASVVVTPLVATLGAVLVFAFLIRVSHVPMPPFLSIATAALLVSFGGPFSLTTETSLGTKLLLCAMNLLTGIVVVAGLIGFTRRPDPKRLQALP